METLTTRDQLRAYERYIHAWKLCNFFGIIISVADRINDVPNYLIKLGVDYLIPYIWVDEKTNAFVYKANLGMKNGIIVVEIYHNLRPQPIEWRLSKAQLALKIEDDLIYGLDEGVVITEFTVPFLNSALDEAMLIY